MISVELVPLSSFQRLWGGNSGCQASLYLLSTQQTGTRHFNTAETHATTTGVSLLSNSIALFSLSLPFVVPSPLPSLGNSSSSLLIALVLSGYQINGCDTEPGDFHLSVSRALCVPLLPSSRWWMSQSCFFSDSGRACQGVSSCACTVGIFTGVLLLLFRSFLLPHSLTQGPTLQFRLAWNSLRSPG